jgi:hypothetical protein
MAAAVTIGRSGESSLLQRGGNDTDGRTLHTEHDRLLPRLDRLRQ